MDFVDSGHDLIIAGDTNASPLIREVATECGVDFDEVQFFNVTSFISFTFNWFTWYCYIFPTSSSGGLLCSFGLLMDIGPCSNGY